MKALTTEIDPGFANDGERLRHAQKLASQR